MSFLKNCPLESLNLRSCEKIKDDALGHIGALSNLKYLNLKGCYGITSNYPKIKQYLIIFQDEGIKKMVQNSILNLNVERCVLITDESLLHISKTMKNLISLQLDGCKVINLPWALPKINFLS